METTPETPAEKVTRIRRTDEQLLADLQARQAEIEARKAAREAKAGLKEDTTGGSIMLAIQGIDRAIRNALDSNDSELANLLEGARAPLGEAIVRRFGIVVPPTRLKVGGRKPKAEKEA